VPAALLLAAGVALAEDDAPVAGVAAGVAVVGVFDAGAAGFVVFVAFADGVLELTTWPLVAVFGAVFAAVLFVAVVAAIATGAAAGAVVVTVGPGTRTTLFTRRTTTSRLTISCLTMTFWGGAAAARAGVVDGGFVPESIASGTAIATAAKVRMRARRGPRRARGSRSRTARTMAVSSGP
jgi:hypothetical protein